MQQTLTGVCSAVECYPGLGAPVNPGATGKSGLVPIAQNMRPRPGRHCPSPQPAAGLCVPNPGALWSHLGMPGPDFQCVPRVKSQGAWEVIPQTWPAVPGSWWGRGAAMRRRGFSAGPWERAGKWDPQGVKQVSGGGVGGIPAPTTSPGSTDRGRTGTWGRSDWQQAFSSGGLRPGLVGWGRLCGAEGGLEETRGRWCLRGERWGRQPGGGCTSVCVRVPSLHPDSGPDCPLGARGLSGRGDGLEGLCWPKSGWIEGPCTLEFGFPQTSREWDAGGGCSGTPPPATFSLHPLLHDAGDLAPQAALRPEGQAVGCSAELPVETHYPVRPPQPEGRVPPGLCACPKPSDCPHCHREVGGDSDVG